MSTGTKGLNSGSMVTLILAIVPLILLLVPGANDFVVSLADDSLNFVKLMVFESSFDGRANRLDPELGLLARFGDVNVHRFVEVCLTESAFSIEKEPVAPLSEDCWHRLSLHFILPARARPGSLFAAQRNVFQPRRR